MESVDKLREWMKDPRIIITKKTEEDLLEMFDAVEDEAKRAWQDGFDAGFANADELLGYHDEEWAKHGYYRWQDADSETIRIGDKVSTEEFGEVEVEGFIHNAVAFYNYEEQPARLCTIPTKLCHHRAQTVEDILRGVVTLCYNTWKKESAFHFCDVEDMMDSGNIAEYAAKLRLAGDE